MTTGKKTNSKDSDGLDVRSGNKEELLKSIQASLAAARMADSLRYSTASNVNAAVSGKAAKKTEFPVATKPTPTQPDPILSNPPILSGPKPDLSAILDGIENFDPRNADEHKTDEDSIKKMERTDPFPEIDPDFDKGEAHQSDDAPNDGASDIKKGEPAKNRNLGSAANKNNGFSIKEASRFIDARQREQVIAVSKPKVPEVTQAELIKQGHLEGQKAMAATEEARRKLFQAEFPKEFAQFFREVSVGHYLVQRLAYCFTGPESLFKGKQDYTLKGDEGSVEKDSNQAKLIRFGRILDFLWREHEVLPSSDTVLLSDKDLIKDKYFTKRLRASTPAEKQAILARYLCERFYTVDPDRLSTAKLSPEAFFHDSSGPDIRDLETLSINTETEKARKRSEHILLQWDKLAGSKYGEDSENRYFLGLLAELASYIWNKYLELGIRVIQENQTKRREQNANFGELVEDHALEYWREKHKLIIRQLDGDWPLSDEEFSKLTEEIDLLIQETVRAGIPKWAEETYERIKKMNTSPEAYAAREIKRKAQMAESEAKLREIDELVARLNNPSQPDS